MAMRAWSLVLISSAVVACNAARAPATATTVTLTAAPSVASRPPAGASNGAKLYSELAPSENLSERVVGFSKDDAYLGFTISTCDPCPDEFHFVSPTQPPLDLAYHYDPANDDGSAAAEERAKKDDEAVERHLKELGATPAKEGRALRGPFPHPDLTFATMSSRDDATGKVALLFGAHVDGDAAVYPVRIELGPHPMFEMPKDERDKLASLPPAECDKALADWHEQFPMGDAQLAYANVTRDGRELGVVAIAGGAMWYEAGAVARVSVASFVARVYDETGARHLAAKDFPRAAELFDEAAAATPGDARIARHAACARARDAVCAR